MKAKIAKAIFFQQWNDIDIYIEDTAPETGKVFRRLMERCFSGRYRVYKVFPVGNKAQVVEQCSRDTAENGRPRLYIVDGDLDLLLGTNPKGISRLFVLPVYCIENVLVDKDAAVRILFEEDRHRHEEELEQAFDFPSWVAANDSDLSDLFVEYALMRLFLPCEISVGFKITHLVSSDDGLIDAAKVASRIAEVRREMVDAVGIEKYELSRAKVTKRMAAFRPTVFLVVCSGKDHLLPLLNLRMRSVAKIKCTTESLKIRLAAHCDVSALATQLIKVPAL
ncbi:MAG TPA: DUF4435 domain-containing protein [Armatimonadota bacterium]|nr:DUF4435 domain-containing protein [Armatimonadota bacterium]